MPLLFTQYYSVTKAAVAQTPGYAPAVSWLLPGTGFETDILSQDIECYIQHLELSILIGSLLWITITAALALKCSNWGKAVIFTCHSVRSLVSLWHDKLHGNCTEEWLFTVFCTTADKLLSRARHKTLHDMLLLEKKKKIAQRSFKI